MTVRTLGQIKEKPRSGFQRWTARLIVSLGFMGLVSCGGGGGGSSSLPGDTAPEAIPRPLLIANSSDFTSGAVDDDAASPIGEREIINDASQQLQFAARERPAAAASIAVWQMPGLSTPLPTSTEIVSSETFAIEDKQNVKGYNIFDKANCTAYAAERRDQLARYLQTTGVTSARGALTRPQLVDSFGATSGHAKYWLGAYRRAGYKTGGFPAPGAIVVYGPNTEISQGPLNEFGHVAVVEQVWYDTGTRKITGWYVSERNNSRDGQLKRTCFGVCPSAPSYPGFALRSNKALNPPNLLGFVYLVDSDASAFAVDSVSLTPEQLIVERTGAGRVNLSWLPSGNTSGVKEYVVYRDGSEIARPLSAPWIDKTAAAVGPVCYQVATKLLGSESDQEGLSARTPLVCASGGTFVPPLAAPVLTGTCNVGQISLSWPNSSLLDSLVIVRNGDAVQALPGNSTSFTAAAVPDSRYYLRLRRGQEVVESNVVSLACGTATPQTGSISVPTQSTVDFGEQLVESNTRLPWVATTRQVGGDVVVKGRLASTNTVLWEQTVPSAGFATAVVDTYGLALLTYPASGGVNLQLEKLNADATLAKYSTTITQIAGAGSAYAIDTSLPSNQLSQPWKMARSSNRPLLAVYSGTSTAADGTAPIWIFDVSSGTPRLVKTIRIAGTFAMGLAFHDSDVFVLGGDGVARRYAAEGLGGLKASLALQNPAYELGTFHCSGETCVAKANSTGVLEVVDFAAGTTRFLSVGGAFIERFKIAGGLLVASTYTFRSCKLGVFRLTDGAIQGVQQTIDCMNGTFQLPILAMSIYDEWTSNATVVAWTSSYTDASSVQYPPRTLSVQVNGLR